MRSCCEMTRGPPSGFRHRVCYQPRNFSETVWTGLLDSTDGEIKFSLEMGQRTIKSIISCPFFFPFFDQRFLYLV